MPSVVLCATVALALVLATPDATASDAETETLARELTSHWIVKIAKDERTRSLQIKGVERKSGNSWMLDATYGWPYTEDQSSVQAELTSMHGGGYELRFATSADSLIVAQSSDAGVFAGTFEPSGGSKRDAVLRKVSAEEFARHRAASIAYYLARPGQDVPADCAAFVGRWTGVWTYGYQQMSLWVTEVSPACVAKVGYPLRTSAPDLGLITARIKDGVLVFDCQSTYSGKCKFRRVGADLWGSVERLFAPSSSGVFKRTGAPAD